MSVYVSKRNESKVLFLETARKLSAHTLTYCLKAPKKRGTAVPFTISMNYKKM